MPYKDKQKQKDYQKQYQKKYYLNKPVSIRSNKRYYTFWKKVILGLKKDELRFLFLKKKKDCKEKNSEIKELRTELGIINEEMRRAKR